MRVPLRLLPLLLLLTGGFAAPASAAVPFYETETMAFDVRISGSHVVDWAYASDLKRENCSSWAVGKGRFEATFRASKPTRFELVEIRRDGRLTETRWGAVRGKLPTFTIGQTGTWKSNYGLKLECTACGPLSEYGPCEPDPPARPEPSCPKRTATGVVDTTFYRRGRDVPKEIDDLGHLRGRGSLLVVETRYSEDEKHARGCYPGARGEGLPLAQPAAVVVPVRRLLRLDRGQSVELKGDRPEWVKSDALQDEAQCGPIEGVLEMNGCGLTKLKLQVRRVR
jgi:hypothetical protein